MIAEQGGRLLKNKIVKFLFPPLIAAFFLMGLAACGGARNDVVYRPLPTVTVDMTSLVCPLGGSVTLAAATASDGDEGDISASVRLRVYAGETEVASFPGYVKNAFTPAAIGEYAAKYTVTNAAGYTSDTHVVKITVHGGAYVKPPRLIVGADAVTHTGTGAAVLKTAVLENGVGAVGVYVYDSFGALVGEGDGAAAHSCTFLQEGTYTVVYRAAGAEEKSYLLTVTGLNNRKPVLTTPTAAGTVFKNEPYRISTASGHDLEDGDISGNVTYVIKNAHGEIVKPSASAASVTTHTFTAAGDYRVVYALSDSGGVSADESGFDVTVIDSTQADVITLDGNVAESKYFDIPAYTFGPGGGVTYRFAATDQGLYIGAIVKDSTLIKEKASVTGRHNRLNHTDGLEFMFCAKDSDAHYINRTNSVRIRIGIDGVYYYQQSKNEDPGVSGWDQWQDLPDKNISGQFAVRLSGAVAVRGETPMDELIYADGYSMELCLKWSDLGYDGPPKTATGYQKDYIRIAFGQRDVSHTTVNNEFALLDINRKQANYNNSFYNGMAYARRDKVATEGLNPNLYSYLYVSGGVLGVNPSVHDASVVLDGYMEQAFWRDAVDIPYGVTSAGASVTAKIKLKPEGVYAGIYVKDRQIVGMPRGFFGDLGILGNDCIDLRIAVNAEKDRFELVDFDEKDRLTDSKIILFDALGSAYMQMFQPVSATRSDKGSIDQYVFTRTNKPMAFYSGTTVNGTVGYSKAGDAFKNNRFIADTDCDDRDGGWGIEVFIPWETLNVAKPAQGASITLKPLLTVYDRRADSTGTSWTTNHVLPGAINNADATKPKTYFTVSQAF
jgi:hypothetical protein